MNDPAEVKTRVISERKLSTDQPNSVIVIVHTRYQEIIVNQTTGHQTLRSNKVSSSFRIDMNLPSANHHDIQKLLHDRFLSYPWCCVCNTLASKISTAAIDLGFGYNGFTLTMTATVIYKTVTVTSNEEESSRIVLLGKKAEELKSLNMESESCSICLENFIGPKPSEPTRMTCSHVFHIDCLLEWLKRKNTCPLCRTVLYDQ